MGRWGNNNFLLFLLFKEKHDFITQKPALHLNTLVTFDSFLVEFLFKESRVSNSLVWRKDAGVVLMYLELLVLLFGHRFKQESLQRILETDDIGVSCDHTRCEK